MANALRESDKPAVIVQHCAVFGAQRTPVRSWAVGEAKSDARRAVTVHVYFTRLGKRTRSYILVTPGNVRYLTIEAGDKVVYDSREEVPCDMGEWEKTAARFQDNLPVVLASDTGRLTP